MLNTYTIFYHKPTNFNKTYYQNANRNVGSVIVKGEESLVNKVHELTTKGVEITKIINGIGHSVKF